MLVLIIVSIILIIGSYFYGRYNTELSMLRGFWETNDEFNDEAGLHSFCFYVGDQKKGKYPSYLLMVDNENNVLINEPVQFTISNTINLLCNKPMKIKFCELETKLMPKNINFTFYPQTCKIVLSDAKKIYAVFFKNPALSELERINNETKL